MDAQFTGSQISQFRKSLGLTQKELAEQLHVTDKAVSKWERGVNFPDLGLMESLADALNTTPAVLLGLEEANQDETLSALAEISAAQLEEARADLRVFSWGSLVTAMLLGVAYYLTQKRAVQVYYLLHGMITVIGIVGFIYLFKYDQIKKWNVPELGSFFGALLPVLIWNGWYFLTGYSPSPVFTGILIVIASVFAQIHFLQVMGPRFVQLLPLVLNGLYVLWKLFFGGITFFELLPGICTLAVWIFHVIRHPGHWKINWKALGIVLCIAALLFLILCLTCYHELVKAYVTANDEQLESYAEDLLESGQSGTYGLWDVTVYPELGVVEFRVGGSGLAPGSIYEGFYYSVSGEHVPFPGFANQDENLGNDALFRDPNANSDNWQHSTQFAPNWFWFELHY